MGCFSIVVLAYDCEKTLEVCLESIVSKGAEAAELICVMNGSKDSSLTLINEFIEEKPDTIVLDGPWLSDEKAVVRGTDAAATDNILVLSATEQLTDDLLSRAMKAWGKGDRVYCSGRVRSKKRDTIRNLKRVMRAVVRRIH